MTAPQKTLRDRLGITELGGIFYIFWVLVAECFQLKFADVLDMKFSSSVLFQLIYVEVSISYIVI